MYPIRTHLQTLFTTIWCFCFYILIYFLKMRIFRFHAEIILDVIPYRMFSFTDYKNSNWFLVLYKIYYSNNIHEHTFTAVFQEPLRISSTLILTPLTPLISLPDHISPLCSCIFNGQPSTTCQVSTIFP